MTIQKVTRCYFREVRREDIYILMKEVHVSHINVSSGVPSW